MNKSEDSRQKRLSAWVPSFAAMCAALAALSTVSEETRFLLPVACVMLIIALTFFIRSRRIKDSSGDSNENKIDK